MGPHTRPRGLCSCRLGSGHTCWFTGPTLTAQVWLGPLPVAYCPLGWLDSVWGFGVMGTAWMPLYPWERLTLSCDLPLMNHLVGWALVGETLWIRGCPFQLNCGREKLVPGKMTKFFSPSLKK